MNPLREFCTKRTLTGLGLGQFLSLLITSTGFFSSELAKKGINAPTSQSFLNYLFLAIVYGCYMLYRRKALKAKWHFYVLLALVDVEANFLVVKAYQYTSLTSVMLLDCWSIPCVMLLTWLFLKTKYRHKKILGVLVCVGGLVTIVFSDVHSGDRAGGSNPWKGDVLVIASSTLYAVTNVSEEFFVKSADRVELMSMLGAFGAIVSAVQISILERNELKSIHWTAGAELPFIGFSVAMFLFYSFVPILLKNRWGMSARYISSQIYSMWWVSVDLISMYVPVNGSTMLNLSLLSSDMWAVLIRMFAYHEKVDWMYFLAFFLVTVGLIIYSWSEKEEDQHCSDVADDEAERHKLVDEEACSVTHCSGTSGGGSTIGKIY